MGLTQEAEAKIKATLLDHPNLPFSVWIRSSFWTAQLGYPFSTQPHGGARLGSSRHLAKGTAFQLNDISTSPAWLVASGKVPNHAGSK